MSDPFDPLASAGQAGTGARSGRAAETGGLPAGHWIGRGAWRAFAAQTRIELLLASRRYENLLVTLGVPLFLLVALVIVPVVPGRAGARTIDRLVPGVLAAALMSTGLVSLGIATAFERSFGVLKRLIGSPLPRWALVVAKTVTVLLTVTLQVALISILGGLLGWAPPGGVLAAVAAVSPWLIVGTIAFAGMGLLLAGTFRFEAVLAAANGLFVVFLLLGGVVVPLDQLPSLLATPVSVLPPALLTELLRGALEPGRRIDPIHAAVLAAWAIGLAAAAVLSFRSADD
jgi:ABC-2 type transport system permease protein